MHTSRHGGEGVMIWSCLQLGVLRFLSEMTAGRPAGRTASCFTGTARSADVPKAWSELGKATEQ